VVWRTNGFVRRFRTDYLQPLPYPIRKVCPLPQRDHFLLYWTVIIGCIPSSLADSIAATSVNDFGVISGKVSVHFFLAPLMVSS
jgi:hypothetical protein